MDLPHNRQRATTIERSAYLRIGIQADSGEMNKYPAKAHCQRVGQTLAAKKSFIVLAGERTDTFSNADQYRTFRQDRYFYYLTGCNEPGCFVTYDVDADKLILWLPPISTDRVFYDGRGSTVEEAMQLYDIDEAYYIHGTTGYTFQAYIEAHHRHGEFVFMPSLLSKLDATFSDKAVFYSIRMSQPNADLRTIMDACRAVKDEYEIAMIRKANEISAQAHLSILKNLHALKSEPEVEAVYSAVCIARGAREQSYNPIVGSGPNASQLHYMTNRDNFGDRQLLLVDAGSDWQCYASDVTRTMPINPKHPGTWQSKEAEAVYRHVEKIQEECIAMIQPGAHWLKITLHSIRMAIDALIDLGILKGDPVDIYNSGVSRGLYPHGLGHHVGLEVHDANPAFIGRLSKISAPRAWSNKTQYTEVDRRYLLPAVSINHDPSEPRSELVDPALVPGMILTVEPGIYFNQWGIENMVLDDPQRAKFVDQEVLKRYMHVGGVRIEDDILVTRHGNENLTTAPKGKEMLRIIREAAEKSK